MTENDYEFLCKHLKGWAIDNKSSYVDSSGFSDSDIEKLFDPSCDCWKVLYGLTDDPVMLKNFIILCNGFMDHFVDEIKYRAWRLANDKYFQLPFCVGDTYYRIEKDYIEVRRLIASNKEYVYEQKKAYIVLMARGLLNAFAEEKTDQDFYNLFMQSKLCKQAIIDREMILNGTLGKCLYKTFPDMFSPLENLKIPESYLDK